MASDNSCSIIIDGHNTDISFKAYSNRILLVITQYSKFGSLVSVDKDPDPKVTDAKYDNIKHLFGVDNEQIQAAARFIAEKTNIDRALLLSISLKDYKPQTLKQVVFATNKVKVW